MDILTVNFVVENSDAKILFAYLSGADSYSKL